MCKDEGEDEEETLLEAEDERAEVRRKTVEAK